MTAQLQEMNGEQLLVMMVAHGGPCRAEIDDELDRRAKDGPPNRRIRHGRAHLAGRAARQLVA